MLQASLPFSHSAFGGGRHRSPFILYRFKSTVSTTHSVHWWDRIRLFPNNVLHLYRDCLRIKDIYDASHTPNNTWTNRYGVMGRIPRRQQEQERQLINDLRIIVPLLILWIPPIIGYLPLVAAIAWPRQSLSRQFLNDHEKEQFAFLEMNQRRMHYTHLAEYTLTSLSILDPHNKRLILQQHQWGEDAAGPLWDLEPLLNEFLRTNLMYAEALPTTHLKALSLANGYFQRFPPLLAKFLTTITPRLFMIQEMKRLGFDVWRDDRLCLEEQYHLNRCNGMTDDEVREACLLRGLPILFSCDEMRDCLTNHLIMMENLWMKRGHNVPKQHLQMFVLFVPAIRQLYKTP